MEENRFAQRIDSFEGFHMIIYLDYDCIDVNIPVFILQTQGSINHIPEMTEDEVQAN